ncbi:hypothetical protein H5410_052264 [Solanum commersonii]|uniref:Uncharacterized protein n=1 Tax=Solanum commersonii TaxID=4109 RepID=A0A9J5X2I0_SOLCO|nr:hypothetical protein H5410_052264 [Solanum commersonii]
MDDCLSLFSTQIASRAHREPPLLEIFSCQDCVPCQQPSETCHLEAMLLGLFKSANGCMSDSPKVVYFWRIRDRCGIKSEESAQLSLEGDFRFLFSRFVSMAIVVFAVHLEFQMLMAFDLAPKGIPGVLHNPLEEMPPRVPQLLLKSCYPLQHLQWLTGSVFGLFVFPNCLSNLYYQQRNTPGVVKFYQIRPNKGNSKTSICPTIPES